MQARRDVIDAAFANAVGGFAELSDHLSQVCVAQPTVGQRSGELPALLEALARVSGGCSPESVIDAAPRELCAAGLFDRVMFSWIRGSTWTPEALYEQGPADRVSRELDGPIEELAIPLASPLIEAEVVRRRLPALVQNAQTEPRACLPLIELTGTREYVVAPVVAASSVIGLLHADTDRSGRSLTSIDRDLLRMFADSFGLIYEHASLAERAERRRQNVAHICEAAVRSLHEMNDGPPAGTNAPAFDRAVTVGCERPTKPRRSSRLSRLTVRELEVLALLASGATNAQLADQLTVAESTVKSHVKHILHKLGAGNRAGAIACYLREGRVDERRSR